MKKKLIIIIMIILIIIIGIIIFLNKNNNKDLIKLSSKYYNKGDYIKLNSEDIKELSSETYLLFTYNNYCALQIPCDKVFKEFMEEYKIDMISIPIEEFKKTSFYKTVLYAPSVMVIKDNKVIAYLDANKDEDLDKYQDSKEFASWVKKYVSLKK